MYSSKAKYILNSSMENTTKNDWSVIQNTSTSESI